MRMARDGHGGAQGYSRTTDDGAPGHGTLESSCTMGLLADLVCVSSLEERDSWLHP